MPPSGSGVARYAENFAKVLALLGKEVWILPLRVSVYESQRLRTVAWVCATTVHLAKRRRLDVLHVELSGRALAEFYAALAVTVLCPDTRLWLTIHDAPQITGGAGYLTLLDKKILRRIANWFSLSIGRRLERFLLQRAELVCCLSTRGAKSTEELLQLDHVIHTLPFVSSLPPSPSRGEGHVTILCPGHIGAADMVIPVFNAVAQAPAGTDVRVEIGACNAAVEATLRNTARRLGIVEQVTFLGYMSDQSMLDVIFARAAIVVRLWPAEFANQGNWAAVSGALISAMAFGCAIISSDPRGTREYINHGYNGLDLVGYPNELTRSLIRLIADPELRARLGAAAREGIAMKSSPEAVAKHIRSLVAIRP